MAVWHWRKLLVFIVSGNLKFPASFKILSCWKQNQSICYFLTKLNSDKQQCSSRFLIGRKMTLWVHKITNIHIIQNAYRKLLSETFLLISDIDNRILVCLGSTLYWITPYVMTSSAKLLTSVDTSHKKRKYVSIQVSSQNQWLGLKLSVIFMMKLTTLW